MSGQILRAPTEARIERTRALRFTFDGASYWGYQGDTLASALIANGVRVVGRSFKYHRPRGIYAAGAEEPNALVQLRTGSRTEPNTRATQIELYDGLVAESQNRWPSVRFDLGAVNNLLSPLFPAGFYYKTFMWPASLWMTYEAAIRRMAGLGRAPAVGDPDRYEKMHAHCDVLVVGGGPAGLAAALAAARSGARVVVAEQEPDWGGALRADDAAIAGEPAIGWADAAVAELAALPDVTLLPRTTVFGYYDHGMIGAVERVADHRAEASGPLPRQRFWKIRAARVVLATGAIERPIAFSDNDRPGVMLASAVRAYANRFAVKAGQRVTIFTNNDSGYAAGLDLKRIGADVAAIVDSRHFSAGLLPTRARAAGIEILFSHAVVRAHGAHGLQDVEVARIDASGNIVGPIVSMHCDALGVSGGWSPSVHLFSQSGGKVVYDPAIAAFVPGASKQAEESVGAARGRFALADCLADGFTAGARAAAATGFGDGTAPATPACEEPDEAPIQPLWAVARPGGRGKRFVDIQDDVTADDIALAEREAFRSVEHLKRYTTLGMGTDQGKTSNVNGLAIMAGIRGRGIPEVGTTTFRPPFTPVTLGALAGREVGHHFVPVRRSAMHDWHARHGAIFGDAGLWLRPKVYQRAGESFREAVRREARLVREGVGLVDVSTLGKIDIQGADAAELLDRLYTNGWKKLEVGRARYGLMLREDGIVFDDGTTTRLDENHFLMTTTTVNAVKVMQHIDYYLQVVWPELDAMAVSVTEQWAAMALAGPKSRDTLARAVEGLDVSDAGLPHMGCRIGRIAGVQARIFRISFSGELAYEVNVPADHGERVWQALLDAGAELGLAPYGTEAMGSLRIEKGHVTGTELDGRTTADDLGMGRMMSKAKDFIGKRLAGRPGLLADRQQLVGLVPVDRTSMLSRGAQLVSDPAAEAPGTRLGHVTAGTFSAALQHPVALALLENGRARKGERLWAVFPLQGLKTEVEVVDPVHVDPTGGRMHV